MVINGRVTSFAVLLVLGIASVISYINDLDFLVVVFQIMSLMASKKIRYNRGTSDFSNRPEPHLKGLFGPDDR